MKVGIMQPYFFPYLGYFCLIKHTNLFILLDEVQFIRHGWIERNRILNQNSDWIYIKVPLTKHNRETSIKLITINNELNWKEKVLSQLAVYKKVAPNYYRAISLVKTVFENDFSSITELNKRALEVICNYLGFDADIRVFSEMNISIPRPNLPDEWALEICKQIGGVSEYWNPEGGKSFFDEGKYLKASIDIRFIQTKLVDYGQFKNTFIPGLSIIDVIMFNSVEVINNMLDNYEFI